MNETNDTGITPEQELEALKARATLLKVDFHPSIGAAKLREKIAAKMAEVPDDDASVDDAPPPAVAAPVAVAETEAQKRLRLRREAEKLVRIRVTCMNPAKKEWEGEIITVGNATVGTLKKFIPFNGADEGWHVPHMMYQVLKDRMCQVFYTEKTKNGVSVRKGRLIKEFAIEVLPDLTQADLDELARRQAMAKSID